MSSTDASDIVIIDETEPCPYLDNRVARMPLRMPMGKVSPAQADVRLAEGHRRTGEFIYQTKCPACKACEAIRLDCFEFQFSRNHRRTLNQGDRLFRQNVGPLKADSMRVDLFNRHRRHRGLAKRDTEIDIEEYSWGFVRSCFESFEITYWDQDELVCLAVCDRGHSSLSAVYTFYDPERMHVSLGTYSILKQIKYCKENNFQYLYLGYYVENSPHMRYKSRFVPNERLIDGQWVRFDQDGDESA
ncbi:MAG: arginyltransferase [Planctomycetota bacterium]